MENTAVEQTTTEAPGTHATPDVVIGEDQPSQGETGQSLMGEQAPSEAELKGAEGTETKASEEQGGEEGAKAPAEGDNPPTGYVPHAALHEERTRRQELDKIVQGLQEKVARLEQEPEPEEDAFKVLSDEEFDELAEEDPVEAVKYERALNKHLRAQESKTAETDARQRQQDQDSLVVTQSLERMGKAVPGIHDEGNTINQELTQFAIDNGFESDFLQAMTAPGTLILPPGAKQAVLLGEGAAGLVELVGKFYRATKGQTTRKVPTGGSESEKGGVLGAGSEQDYAEMSPAEREKFLGG